MFKNALLLALALAAGLSCPAFASERGYARPRAPLQSWRARPIASAVRPAALRRYAVARSRNWRFYARHASSSWAHAAPRTRHAASFVALAPAAGGVGGLVGRASFYSGGRTASGGLVGAATCAHRSLPFGTRVLVTNLANLRQMVLTVNDRGPFIGGRMMDVSRTAAAALGMLQSGVANIRMQVLGGRG